MINYYELLGINRNSSSKEIKDAYKKLSLKIHPDVIGDSSASSVFRMVLDAKNTLLNDNLRKEYDREIENISFNNVSNQEIISSDNDIISQDPDSSIVSLSYVLHVENLISFIKKEHDTYNKIAGLDNQYGTLEVDAIDLICGVKNKKINISGGNHITVDIKPNSSPGDFGVVTSNGSSEKAILLLNKARTDNSLYYKNKAYLIFSVSPDLLLHGGEMDVSYVEEAKRAGVSIIEISKNAPPVYEKTTEKLNFIFIDERILDRIHSSEKM